MSSAARHRLRHVITGLAAAVMAVGTLTVMDSCSGCGRHGSTPAGSVPADSVPSQQPEAILNGPAVHDPQMLRQYAGAAGSNAVFSDQDFATMIVLCEGSLQRLEHEVENLQRNDDPADSFNVLTELASLSWPADLSRVIDFLHSVPFNGSRSMRVDAILAQRARINTQVSTLQNSQLRGQVIFQL